MKNASRIAGVIQQAISAGLNVLLEGRFGVGKTSIVGEAAKGLQLRMKYFSASTLDPFADLVGVPVPVMESETRKLVYLRPESIHEADVLFFDELNRAHPKVLNSVFEIIQFHTINGESLPRLRAVVAAINPASAGHHVEDLDPALLDRFHVRLELSFGPSTEWFIEQFGPHLGQTLVKWHETDLDNNQREAISNRRLEYIGRAIQTGIDIRHALPGGVTVPVGLLEARLANSESVLSIENFVAEPDRFVELVGTDLNMAMRFAHLLPMMSPKQKSRVRDVVLALPAEVLSRLKSDSASVLTKCRDAVARFSSVEDGTAFGELLNERLKLTCP